MSGEVVIGIDCGESMHRLVVVDERCNRTDMRWVHNRASALREELGRVKAELGYLPTVVIEAQGGIGSIVEGVVRELDGRLELLSSGALESVRRIEGVTYKDDTIDAELIATSKQRWSKAVRLAAEPTEGERVLKQLGRMRNDLVNQLANLRKQVRSALVELCPQMVEDAWEGPCYMSRGFEAVALHWKGFEGLKQARLATVIKTLRKASRMPHKWCEQKARALREASAEILVQGELRELLGVELTMKLEEIKSKRMNVKLLEAKMDQAIAEHPVGPFLLTMPGVANITATVLLGEVLPIARNATEAQAASYSGITPENRKSGKSTKSRRRGANGLISKTLFNSAVASLKVSALDRRYYDKKRKDFKGQKAGHKKATLCLARQRFKTMYRIMVDQVEYDREKLEMSTRRRQEASE